MPKFTHGVLGAALAALSAVALATPVSAQDSSAQPTRQERADAVVAQVQAFYDQTTSIEGSFHQTYYHRVYRRYQRSTGNMVFDKPGRMRFDYGNGKVVVSDGNLLTAYEPGDAGEAGQYVRKSASSAALPSAFSFLTGQGRIADDFTARLLSSRAWRYDGHVVELRPRRRDPNMRRVVLFVDARPALRGVVHRMRIDDHDGNRNKFDLRRLRFNRDINAARFEYVPPAGSHRIQS